jgi:nicotinate phosphoribosyltransferase
MEPIIKSLLNTDLYKLSMLQAYYHQYPTATGRWVFKCRNKNVKLGFLAQDVAIQINMLKDLKLTSDESDYLESLGYFKEDFVDWLEKDFQVDLDNLHISVDSEGQLQIEVSGNLTHINILEVYILAIVNELYFRSIVESQGLKLVDLHSEGWRRILQKVNKLEDYPNLKFAEFGTRRRFSAEWQDFVVKELVSKAPQNIVGTSNVHLAMKYGIKPIGTVAHEWTMSHLGLVDNIDQAQSRALHVWQQEYGDQLGIALTDTFTSEAFFRDFQFPVARAYSGVRQDSGDPIEFGEKMIAHYQAIGIDPKRKDIIFSDSLNIDKAIKIWRHFAGRTGVSFGIGTSLSNDLGIPALNIVMKLLECNGTPLVKLSDDIGKAMGDKDMIERVKIAYKIK